MTPTPPETPVRFETAEDCVYRMPTLDEVRAAGYDGQDGRTEPQVKWEQVRLRRDELVAQFHRDPEFARQKIADCKADYAAMTDEQRRAWRTRERR